MSDKTTPTADDLLEKVSESLHANHGIEITAQAVQQVVASFFKDGFALASTIEKGGIDVPGIGVVEVQRIVFRSSKADFNPIPRLVPAESVRDDVAALFGIERSSAKKKPAKAESAEIDAEAPVSTAPAANPTPEDHDFEAAPEKPKRGRPAAPKEVAPVASADDIIL